MYAEEINHKSKNECFPYYPVLALGQNQHQHQHKIGNKEDLP
jgi:hypothetical protein